MFRRHISCRGVCYSRCGLTGNFALALALLSLMDLYTEAAREIMALQEAQMRAMREATSLEGFDIALNAARSREGQDQARLSTSRSSAQLLTVARGQWAVCYSRRLGRFASQHKVGECLEHASIGPRGSMDGLWEYRSSAASTLVRQRFFSLSLEFSA
jgi:hypothetical protein